MVEEAAADQAAAKVKTDLIDPAEEVEMIAVGRTTTVARSTVTEEAAAVVLETDAILTKMKVVLLLLRKSIRVGRTLVLIPTAIRDGLPTMAEAAAVAEAEAVVRTQGLTNAAFMVI